MNKDLMEKYFASIDAGLGPALLFIEKNKDQFSLTYQDLILNAKTKNLKQCSEEYEQVVKDVVNLTKRDKPFTSDSAIIYNFLTSNNDLPKDVTVILKQYLIDNPTRFTFMYFMSLLSSNTTDTERLYKLMHELLDSVFKNISPAEQSLLKIYIQSPQKGTPAYHAVMSKLAGALT